MTKLWGGRFKKPFDDDAARFSYSIQSDKILYPYDIAVNTAHALALMGAGILTAEEHSKITNALAKIKFEMDQSLDEMIQGDEDIHSCVERLLILELGDLGKKIHTGKSRNDQVITDTRMFVKDQCSIILELLAGLLNALYRQA